jgi:hypothetical protein
MGKYDRGMGGGDETLWGIIRPNCLHLFSSSGIYPTIPEY